MPVVLRRRGIYDGHRRHSTHSRGKLLHYLICMVGMVMVNIWWLPASADPLEPSPTPRQHTESSMFFVIYMIKICLFCQTGQEKPGSCSSQALYHVVFRSRCRRHNTYYFLKMCLLFYWAGCTSKNDSIGRMMYFIIIIMNLQALELLVFCGINRYPLFLLQEE